MPNSIFPNVAELELLAAWVNAAGSPFLIRLFKNNLTPDQATVVADFTQADFTGYSIVNWNVSSPFSSGNKAHLNPVYAFFSGPTDLVPQDVYGWYVTFPNGSAEVFLCARFAGAPITLSSPADFVDFNLNFNLYDAHQ